MKVTIIQNTRKSIIPAQMKLVKEIGVNFEIQSIRDFKLKDLKDVAIRLTKFEDDGIVMFTNGTDRNDQVLKGMIQATNPDHRMTFSELGWLPYQEYFFLDSLGIGNNASFFEMSMEEISLANLSVDVKVVGTLKQRTLHFMKREKNILDAQYKDYILVPLQVNDDSKMLIGSPYFPRVEDFVAHVIKIVPWDVPILFRNHPLNKNPIPVPKGISNVYDISKLKVNKYDLIMRSKAVWGINSTFLLEAAMVGHHVISFGLDVFSNKPTVLPCVEDISMDFESVMALKQGDPTDIALFMSVLMSRQLPRKPDNTFNYKNSYWGRKFLDD